ncbi:MAG: glycine--tRNA ligase [Halobacteria archaeon]
MNTGEDNGDDVYSRVIELSKRRGFLYPSFEIYGGVAGFWDYGPLGTALKQNVLDSWRDSYVRREGFDEIDTPTIGIQDVFEASGHLDGFADVLAQCRDCGTFYRADHLVEDYTGIENADGYSPDKLEDVISENRINCPSCGEPMSEPVVKDFNLMFETNVGPGSSRPGFLRPETAQGIFVDFQRLKRYFRGKLPFGVSQTGTSYRNEINPRKGVVRLREFRQAEVEYFKKPEQDIERFDEVRDIDLKLYPVEEQEKPGGDELSMTAGEAVEEGVIESKTIAYFVARSKEWYESIGIDPDRLRFRQHLPEERAHYASDCWDGETLTDRFGWIEVNGVADRGSYDLEQHAESSGEDLSVFEEYDEAVESEEVVVEPDMSVLGPEFKGKAGEVADALRHLGESDPDAFEGNVVEVEVDGETIEVDADVAGFERRTVKESGERVVPQVIEPSYGVDRIVYSVIEHSFDSDEIEGEGRQVLRFEPEVAPVAVSVFPLVSKDGLDEKAREIEERLRGDGLRVEYDDSGAIGRRYRRQDEAGTPFTVTVDYETLEDGSVTVRDRDTTDQVRVDVDELVNVVRDLREGVVDLDGV